MYYSYGIFHSILFFVFEKKKPHGFWRIRGVSKCQSWKKIISIFVSGTNLVAFMNSLNNDNIRYALIIYGTTSSILFNFNDGKSCDEKIEIIENMIPIGGATFTKLAFQIG